MPQFLYDCLQLAKRSSYFPRVSLLIWCFLPARASKCFGIHSLEDAEPTLLHHLPVPLGEPGVYAAYLDEGHPEISWTLNCTPGIYRVFVKYLHGLPFDVGIRVNGKKQILPRHSLEFWQGQEDYWQGFMWSEALELELGLEVISSLTIEGIHAEDSIVGGRFGKFASISGLKQRLLFQAISIENVSEKQISRCMACQMLVLSSMLSNAHSILHILDNAIGPSERPDLWIDDNGSSRDHIPAVEFDMVYLHFCAHAQWLEHWSQVLGFSVRSIEDACKQVFLEGPLAFMYIMHKQRKIRKGNLEFPFAATFDSYCVIHTSICTPWEFMPTDLYLALCGPLWSTVTCLERINRPVHWNQHEVEVPYWWYDDARDSTFNGHPFLNKELSHADYQHHIQEAAWRVQHRSDSSLPVARRYFLYLCQASHVDKLPAQYSFFTSQSSELLVTTWRHRTDGALYFPNSTLAEGRQMLFAAARQQERRQGWRYMYWIMLDDDVSFLRGGPREFEAFLSKWEPAVGIPANYWQHAGIRSYQEERADAYAVYHVDHQFIAYHNEVIDELWPFDLRWDTECWWASQWYQGVLASVKYQGHILVSKQVIVLNPVHDSYPRASYKEAFDNATLHARSMLPTKVRHCARFVDDTKFGHAWGQPLQKLGRYDHWRVDGLEADCSYSTNVQAQNPGQHRWPLVENV